MFATAAPGTRCVLDLLQRLQRKDSGYARRNYCRTDGASHQAIEDICLMRAIPNMNIIVPCDGAQTRDAVLCAAATKGLSISGWEDEDTDDR
jgi:transketolase C-terminal domain/subunit